MLFKQPLNLLRSAGGYLLYVVCASAVFANTPTADHSKFEILQQTFSSTQAVNEACISCHNAAEDQLHGTVHWQWSYTAKDGNVLGKLNVINGYHSNVVSNEAACDSCHIGFGFESRFEPPIEPAAVDCLACHDTSGEYFYTRFHESAGECLMCHDDNGESMKARINEEGERYNLSLTDMAKRVGATTSESCGSCHFNDGGADGAKHGDLDSSLYTASHELDVHMSAEGAGFTCSSCHQSNDHQLFGSRYESGSPSDDMGISAMTGARATCVSCHGDRPMQDEKLNDHTDVIACQTCHIPSYARGGVATKTDWDWSTAGELGRNRRPIVEYDEQGNVTYATQKGHMAYGENLEPVLRWFDGRIQYQPVGAEVQVDGITLLAEPLGEAKQTNAKIFPFHEFTSALPYDVESETLVPINLSGRGREPFWNGYDWKRALTAGAKAADLEFSGEYDFAQTQWLSPLNHMVAPKEQALDCQSCHRDDGVLADVSGVYIPGAKQHGWLDQLGAGVMLMTFLGVLGHGGLRLFFGWRRKNK